MLFRSLKHIATPFQEGRSSTPFKVQKIPSPYYGFQERSNKKKEETNYTTILLELEKKPEDFLLFEEHLLNESNQSFVHTEEEQEVEPLLEAEVLPEVEALQEMEVVSEAEEIQETEALPEVETIQEVEVVSKAETIQEVEIVSGVESLLEAEALQEMEVVLQAEEIQEIEAPPEVETIQEVEVVSEAETIQEVEIVSDANIETTTNNSESTVVDSSLNPIKKKRGLSRSLAGMIEEEQNIRLNRGKNVARYFGEGEALPKKAKQIGRAHV